MASGNVVASILAVSTPASNFAVPSMTGARIPIWLFDDTTDETLYYTMYMSDIYDGSSNLTVVIPWKFATYVGSQTCDWEVSFAKMEDDVDTIESLTFATAQTVLATEASATGELDYATITFTNAQADSVGVDDLFCLRVVRDASGGTASPGDAQFVAPIVRQA